MGVLENMVLGVLPLVPKPLMRPVAMRYVAGERLEDALDKLRQLARAGHTGIIDILGEDVEDEAQAKQVLGEYKRAADGVHAAGLAAYVSVKPTHFGLRTSEALALELYAELAEHCAGLGLFLRVEMEDHSTTDATLRVFEALRAEHANTGIVLQSRLLRTPADIDALAPGPLHVRMVKGIYLEPERIAHTEPVPIRDAYFECTRKLFERGAFVSLATHDEVLAARVFELVDELGLGPDRYELQVLLGVREVLWREWVQAGHPVRVYVPFGPEWLPYSLRRLRKNPEILRHVVRATLGLRPSRAEPEATSV